MNMLEAQNTLVSILNPTVLTCRRTDFAAALRAASLRWTRFGPLFYDYGQAEKDVDIF